MGNDEIFRLKSDVEMVQFNILWKNGTVSKGKKVFVFRWGKL